MPETSRITVALPTFNGSRHLREALSGILGQDRVDFELIVADDRSEDDTLSIVREMAGDRARISVNSERLGLAGNWNRCVSLSQTPLVAIFHQDDVMRSGHVAAHLGAFADDPTVGLIASAADVIDEAGRDVPATVVGRGGCGPADRRFGPGAFLAELAAENPLRCSGVTVARAVHEAVGGFDPSYRYVVDWDFWIRVARTHPVTWLAAPTVAIRWHSASETHRFRGGTADLDETVRLLDAFAADFAHFPEARGRADRRLARAFLNRAYTASKAGDHGLARRCLSRSIRLDPRTLGVIASDPKLAARLVGSLIRHGHRSDVEQESAISRTATPPGR
ncbi:glycosyltransferase family 2 protein [Tundrisphaera sp. TA3]|uniref:glycosyltransferase family 2 protein n=1 Tax=Tundrisphaera sp. TA3 TaxID=3435775 RepID=UPI003EBC8107